MSLSLSDSATSEATVARSPALSVAQAIYLQTVWHSLAWLVFANAVGVLLATLLVAPKLNLVLGEWTYGRWMPVHINVQLYGWCSLPLVAFLFKVYGAEREIVAQWYRPALWIWSSALAAGSLSWLTGHSSGKLFLDWTGYSRVLFPLALLALWLVLAYGLVRGWNDPGQQTVASRVVKISGLALLFAVPFLIYIASDPGIYPPVNPNSGGPTGASQLASTLVIIAILLALPFGLTHRKSSHSAVISVAWVIFAAECLLCVGLGRESVSHYRPAQYLSLGSLLVWIPITPSYYGAFAWHANTRCWRIAFLCWWSVLVPTGWCLFLPGILDHIKFTDGLVAHSLLAMAGFVSSLLIFVMVQLLGDYGWIFNGMWSFYLWQGSVLAYVALMFCAGWREGSDIAFVITPGWERNSIYLLRLLLGVCMFVASVDWLVYATKLVREQSLTKAGR